MVLESNFHESNGAAMAERPQVDKAFILAGKATFTLVGKNTRFTYRVAESEPNSAGLTVFFVSVLTGTDNEGDYKYIGLLDKATGRLKLTKKSNLTPDAPAVRAFQWAMPKLMAGTVLPEPAKALHEGKCGRCGRTLTTPESILRGLGPECAEKMGL